MANFNPTDGAATNPKNQWTQSINSPTTANKVVTIPTKDKYLDRDIKLTINKPATAQSAAGTATTTAVLYAGTSDTSIKSNILLDSKIGAEKTSAGSVSQSYVLGTTLKASTAYTLSFDIESTNAIAATSGSSYYRAGVELSIKNTSGGNNYFGKWQSLNATAWTYKGRFVYTFTVPSNYASFNNIGSYIQGLGSGSIKISNVKLEENSVATPWVPNSEDSGITNIKSSISLDSSPSDFYIPVKTIGTGNSKITTAGWIGTGTLGTATATDISYINIPGGSFTNNTSGGTSSGTINAGSQLKIAKGWYDKDYYYTAQAASATTAATFVNVGTSTTDQSSTSGYIPLVSVAGYTAKRWMNSLTVPASKTLSTISLTAGTSSARTYLSTLNVPGYTTISKINLGGILSEISLQGGYAYLKSNDATSGSLVYINSYDNASTPALTGNQLVVQNNKWISTNLSATSNSGTYYGRVVYTKPDDLTVTTSVTADGMSTYFDAGTSTDKSVTITPKYTNTAGYKAALTTATNNGGTAYYKIKTTSGSKNSTTPAKVEWGTGWITAGSQTVTASDLGLSTWNPSSTYFQTSTTGAISGAKYTKNQYNTSDYYVIAGTAGAITGGGLTHGDITTSDTTYLTSTNTGFGITFSNVASRAAASYSITKPGWISAEGTGLAATGNDTKTLTKYIIAGTVGSTGGNVTGSNVTFYSDTTNNGISVTGSGKGKITKAGWIPLNTEAASASTLTKCIKGVKLTTPTSGTNSFEIEVPNGSSTSFIKFTIKVDSNSNVWVE